MAKQSLEPKYLIDTDALNRKYAARADNPYRFCTGTTLVDRELTGGYLTQTLQEAAGRFIMAMEKRDWVLVRKVSVRYQGIGRDIDTNVALFDKAEYHITGVFKYTRSPKMIRTEIPPELIKQPDEL